MDQKPTVLVIDPAALYREGLARLLADAAFDVRLATSSVRQALQDSHRLARVELILFDPGDRSDALPAAVEALRERFPAARLVVMTETFEPHLLGHVTRSGFGGYLLKSIGAEVLVTSLRLVLLGEPVFPADVADLLATGTVIPPAGLAGSVARPKNLSARELEIIACLLAGDSNKVIARRLDIAEATVKIHVKTILRKLGFQNRTQVAIWAHNRGLGQMGPALANASKASGSANP